LIDHSQAYFEFNVSIDNSRVNLASASLASEFLESESLATASFKKVKWHLWI
jgi:hypothetical protein